MKRFDVQGVLLAAPKQTAFAFLADPRQLSRWTHAFASVSDRAALMRTPRGEVTAALEVLASADHGTVDGRMRYPDGAIALAHSPEATPGMRPS